MTTAEQKVLLSEIEQSMATMLEDWEERTQLLQLDAIDRVLRALGALRKDVAKGKAVAHG